MGYGSKETCGRDDEEVFRSDMGCRKAQKDRYFGDAHDTIAFIS